jgi:NhaA family Na+:H+ antiporter
MNPSSSQLPREPADRLTKPFMRFLRIEAMAGAVLLASTVVAIAVANSSWAGPYDAFWSSDLGLLAGDVVYARSLGDWIGDGLMTLFFFVIALELKRELVLGDFRDIRVAAFPIVAALGGMVVPVALFRLIVGDAAGGDAWGVVMSTDTAFLIGSLAVLRDRVPAALRLYLLALAIVDDMGAITVVAIGYGKTPNLLAVVLALAGLGTVALISRLGVRQTPVYFALGGLVWIATDASGLHATLVGVILGLMTPARSWITDARLNAILSRVVAYPAGSNWSGDKAARADLDRAGVATREALSPIEQLEASLHPWVAFAILPLFALANAGLSFEDAGHDPVLLVGIIVAFVIGKPSGVILFSVLAATSGIGRRPPELSWPLVAAGGILTGIGFTMALFVADLAVAADDLETVKAGIMGGSVLAAILGLSCLTWVTRRASSQAS